MESSDVGGEVEAKGRNVEGGRDRVAKSGTGRLEVSRGGKGIWGASRERAPADGNREGRRGSERRKTMNREGGVWPGRIRHVMKPVKDCFPSSDNCGSATAKHSPEAFIAGGAMGGRVSVNLKRKDWSALGWSVRAESREKEACNWASKA